MALKNDGLLADIADYGAAALSCHSAVSAGVYLRRVDERIKTLKRRADASTASNR